MKGTKYTPNMAIMIRPLNFSFNEETSGSNPFQHQIGSFENSTALNTVATKEFNGLVNALIEAGISTCVFSEKSTNIKKPDAIFSNNWVVYMPSGDIYTMPMMAENRRAEIDQSLIIGNSNTFFEKFKDNPLEGTGSMVFDHINKKIYATISPRTSLLTLKDFAQEVGYDVIIIETCDKTGNPVYHTNVMLSIGEDWAVVCTEVIRKNKERLLNSLIDSGREVITISEDQMDKFCGNILELRNNQDDLYIVMSSTAFLAYNSNQLKRLSRKCKIVQSEVKLIEQVGGGSVRCMITGKFI